MYAENIFTMVLGEACHYTGAQLIYLSVISNHHTDFIVIMW